MRFLANILAKAGLVVDGAVTLNNVAAASTNTDRFLVVESGVVKYRTGAQLLSDISAVGGSGAINYVSKFTGATTLGNSLIFDNGTYIGINKTTPAAMLDIVGKPAVATIRYTGRSSDNSTTVDWYSNDGATRYAFQYVDASSWQNTAVANMPMTFGTNNTERLRITSGGNVGIGTTNPLAKLDVASGHIKIDDAFSFYWGAASTSINGSSTTNIIDLYTNSAVRQRIFANGRIGINTTTDAGYQLDVNGTLRTVNGANFATDGTSHIGLGTVPSAWSWPNGIVQLRFGGHIATASNSFIQLGTNSYYDGSDYRRVNNGFASRYLQNDGGHFWSTAPTGNAGTVVTFSERMRITEAGLVGIGTTSPQTAGSGFTGIDIRGSSGGSIVLGSTSSLFSYIYSNSTSHITETTGTIPIIFSPGGTGRMRILSAGNVLIGTSISSGPLLEVNGTITNTQGANFATSTGNVGIGTTSPTERLQVDGTIRVNNGDVTMTNGRGVFWGGGTEYITGSQSTNSLSMLTNNTTRLFITSAGNVGIGTTSPSELLDVNGRIRARTIDNNAAPTFFLTSDANGVIQKSTYAPAGGSGTTNYVARWTSSSALGTGVLFDNGSFVGVGITSNFAGGPRLYVSKTTASEEILRVDGQGGAGCLIISNTASSVQTVFYNGNIGVGTLSPQQKFVVSNVGAEGLEFIPAPSVNSNQIQSYNRSTSAWNSLVLRASEYNVQIGTNPALFINSSSNVGIGTTSPAALLHVYPSTNDMQQMWGQKATGVFSYMRLHRNTSDGTFTFGTAQDGFSSIAFATSNGSNEAFTERMRITTGGNVGIGTTSPLYRLHTVGSGTTAVGFISNSSNFTGGTNFTTPHFVVNSGDDTVGNITRHAITVGTGAQVYLESHYVNSNAHSDFAIRTREGAGVTEKLRITSTGNVGIGTTTPAAYTGYTTLAINNATNSGLIDILSNGTRVASFFSPTTTVNFGAIANIPLLFLTNNNERMRISNTGDVGIGTTSPSARLHVSGSTTTNLLVGNSDLFVSASGNVGIGTTAPSASSILELNSTTRGFLPPKMTAAQRAAITSPAVGLVVYQTDSTEGLWIYTSANGWKALAIVT